MTNFPTTRQLAPVNAEPPDACEDILAQAFSTFNQAAGSLEHTYHALHGEVRKLRDELAGTNQKLSASLAETQRTRAHLENILSCLPCGVVVATDAGLVLSANHEADRLLAAMSSCAAAATSSANTTSELGGPARPFRLPALAWADDDQEMDFEFAPDGSAGATNSGPLTYRIRRSKLSKFSTFSKESTDKVFSGSSELSVAPVVANSAPYQTPPNWVYILRDVTEERTLLREREASRRLTSLAEVSAVLAHEIRNPLASLELFAGLLAKSAEPASDHAVWINHIRAGLRSLAGTVNNVLQLYSPCQPEATALDLRELLAHTVDFLKPLAEQWQVRIAHAAQPDPCTAKGVPHQLQQVFLNIAMNAFRVAPPGSELRITLLTKAHHAAPTATIEFADEGPGIAPEVLERIFEPGFSTRADSPGIGLAVSRKIIEQHGGTITARSQPGAGATFTIEIPCPAPHPAAGAEFESLYTEYYSDEIQPLEILIGATR